MNKVILIGNLTRDPEIKVTQTGKKLARFSIAVNEGKNRDGQEMVQYFNLTAWEKLAEIVESYVKKGHKIAIVGNLQNRSWDKPDGTKGYATDITVREMEMLTSKLEADKINASQAANPTPTNNSTSQTQSTQPNPKNQSEPAEKLPEIDINDMNVSMPF